MAAIAQDITDCLTLNFPNGLMPSHRQHDVTWPARQWTRKDVGAGCWHNMRPSSYCRASRTL